MTIQNLLQIQAERANEEAKQRALWSPYHEATRNSRIDTMLLEGCTPENTVLRIQVEFPDAPVKSIKVHVRSRVWAIKKREEKL